MRIRKAYVIITFATTTQAMALEAYAVAHGIAGRLIPLPSGIGAGCGLCWRMEPMPRETLSGILTGASLRWEAIYDTEM